MHSLTPRSYVHIFFCFFICLLIKALHCPPIDHIIQHNVCVLCICSFSCSWSLYSQSVFAGIACFSDMWNAPTNLHIYFISPWVCLITNSAEVVVCGLISKRNTHQGEEGMIFYSVLHNCPVLCIWDLLFVCINMTSADFITSSKTHRTQLNNEFTILYFFTYLCGRKVFFIKPSNRDDWSKNDSITIMSLKRCDLWRQTLSGLLFPFSNVK